MTNLKLRLFHLDDDPFEIEEIERRLTGLKTPCSFGVTSFSDPKIMLKRLRDQIPPDVVLVDIHLADHDISGLQVIEDIKALHPKVVIVARSSDMRRVVEAIRNGASDFVVKRSDEDELAVRLYTAYRTKMPQGSVSTADASTLLSSTFETITRRIPRLIESAVTAIHLAGETGVGKSMVANAFRAALKPGTPFLIVNCGAIAPNLLESELFGHIRGAFTGANNDKTGYLEAASGGWLFLDEVASLSLSAQAALLLALENQEIIRVGDNKTRKIQTKILSATNEDLANLVNAGKFRKDFWQRLCEVEITIAPLRERTKEIKTLADHFCEIAAGGPYRLSPAAAEVLCAYDWREGNVRELRNCIRAMTERHINGLLAPIAIPERIWQAIDSKPENEEPSRMAMQSDTNHPAGFHIDLRWDSKQSLSFDDISDLMLAQLVKQVILDTEINSLRKLSIAIGLARSTLAIKLKQLVDKNLLKRTELVALNSKELM